MKRMISLLLLICLMIPAAAFAEEHEYIGRMMVVNCKKEVSLRAEPTQNSERLTWVAYHTVLENCWSGYGDYYYVEYDGMPGYIHSDYLEVYDGPDELYYSEYYEVMQVVGAPDWTPLREMADVNSKELAKLPNGAILTSCIYYADDYTYVEYNGLEGYVLTEYITLGSENVAEPDLSVKYVTNCNEEVSLRAKPTSASERLAWVPKGTAIEALDAKDGYFYVCYEGQYGYIFGDYLAYIGYTGSYIGEMVTVNCSQGVPMLAEPAPGFGWLELIPEGTVLESCYEAHDGYYFAVYGDLYGYVHGDYLKASAEDLPREDPAEVPGDTERESYGSMRVVRCAAYASMYPEPDYETDEMNRAPLGAIVTDCERVNDEFFYCFYDGVYGYIDGYFLEAIEGPYSDADDILSNARTTLNSMGVGFGVYLISDSMGGEWSILQEKHHLQNVLNGVPEEWRPLMMTIPEEQIIEIIGGHHLFLIIPSDEDASVTVNKLLLGNDGFTGIAEEVLYESETGEPFLLRCNEYDFAMDSEILIAEADSDEYGWYPDVLPSGRIFAPQVEDAVYFDLTVYEGE